MVSGERGRQESIKDLPLRAQMRKLEAQIKKLKVGDEDPPAHKIAEELKVSRSWVVQRRVFRRASLAFRKVVYHEILSFDTGYKLLLRIGSGPQKDDEEERKQDKQDQDELARRAREAHREYLDSLEKGEEPAQRRKQVTKAVFERAEELRAQRSRADSTEEAQATSSEGQLPLLEAMDKLAQVIRAIEGRQDAATQLPKFEKEILEDLQAVSQLLRSIHSDR